ncbi:collagen-like protein, partial [Lactobacillus sp. SL9-6]
MTTIKQPLAGLITMPVDAEVMNALVPDDYTIEVWVTLSSLITPGSQEGLTDTSTDGTTTDTTTSTTDTTTYNAIFPSDDPQGFTITENVMSDSGDVIPVMSLDEFQQEFDQLKTDLTNQVSTLQGPAGKDGENGKDGATGPQGPQGIQGPKGDTGQGLEIKGKVDTTSQLPATASEGDGYLVAEELYIWTNNAWKDCGPIQGPAGKDGATGPQGPKGDTGATGAQGIQGPKGDTGETGPAGKDGTAKFEELADGTDLFSLVVNDAQSHYYLCSSNASAKTLKNSPVATAFSLELYPANTPQSVASNGVAEWAYTQMVLRPFNSSTAWIASTNSDGSGNISNTNWVQVASISDVATAISSATANMVDSTKSTNFTNGLQSGGVDVATAADIKSIEDQAWRELTGSNNYLSYRFLYKVNTDSNCLDV